MEPPRGSLQLRPSRGRGDRRFLLGSDLRGEGAGQGLERAGQRGEILGISENLSVPEIYSKNRETISFPLPASPDAWPPTLVLAFPRLYVLGLAKSVFLSPHRWAQNAPWAPSERAQVGVRQPRGWCAACALLRAPAESPTAQGPRFYAGLTDVYTFDVGRNT